MVKTVVVIFTSLLCASLGAFELKIATGNKKGTYFKIGQSLNALPKLKLQVIESSGSVDNINRIWRGDADLALCQLDILLQADTIPLKRRQKVKIVMPLYNEEVHVLYKTDINSFSSLKQRRIHIGPFESGGEASSQIMLRFLGKDNLKNTALVRGNTASAIQQLQSGDVDAAFLIAGIPAGQLQGAELAGLKLMSFDQEALNFFSSDFFPYQPATIPAGTYDWHKVLTRTIAIPSALVASTDIENKKILRILNKITGNLSQLQSIHKKWQQVKIDNAVNLLQSWQDSFHPASVEYFKTYQR